MEPGRQHLLVILPGNPGEAVFYRELVALLSHSLVIDERQRRITADALDAVLAPSA